MLGSFNKRSPAIGEKTARTAFSGIAVQFADDAIPDLEISAVRLFIVCI